jgi:RND family efflux transporter MFP subunit
MTVARTTIEDGTPISGNLRPIQTVQVRARLEGDLDAVLVREGERVRQGQLLAHIEASQQESGVRSAEAERAAAQTELTTSQWNYEQSQELFKEGAIAERDLRAAEQAASAGNARLAAAESRVRATSSDLRDTRVLASTTGTIERKLVESGEHVARGAPLFTLVQNDILELAAAVPAHQANRVAVGQSVHFAVDGRPFSGRVARVSPTIDPVSRAVTVYAQIPNPDGALKGGSFATGNVVARTLTGVLAVPAAAVRLPAQQGGKPFVYRIDGSRLTTAQVQLGVEDDSQGLVEVTTGLAEGDRVVVGNVGTLGRDMQIEIIGGDSTTPPASSR